MLTTPVEIVVIINLTHAMVLAMEKELFVEMNASIRIIMRIIMEEAGIKCITNSQEIDI